MRAQAALLALVLPVWLLATPPATRAASDWAGVDEKVVEKFAHEAGRPPRQPLIDTDRGDLLLFVFLVAGAAGGFVAGYCWRALFTRAGRGKDRPASGGERNAEPGEGLAPQLHMIRRRK